MQRHNSYLIAGIMAMRVALGATPPPTLETTPEQAVPDSAKALYDFQERCGKRAEAVFKEVDGRVVSTADTVTTTDFENHFSTTFHKCFALVTTQVLSTKGNATGAVSTAYALLDINEHKQVASMFKLLSAEKDAQAQIVVCIVNGQRCHSEAEFRALIKPNMEM